MTSTQFYALSAALWLTNSTPYSVSVSRYGTLETGKLEIQTGWQVSEGDMVLFAPSQGADYDGQACPCDQFSDDELLDFAQIHGWHRGLAA